MKLKALSVIALFSISITGLHGFSRNDLHKMHRISAIAATPGELSEALSGDRVKETEVIENVSVGMCRLLGAALETDEMMAKINRVLAAFNLAKNGRNPGQGEGALQGWNKDLGKRVGLDVTFAIIQQLANDFACATIGKNLPENNQRPLRRLTRAFTLALIASLIEGSSSKARNYLHVEYTNADATSGLTNDSNKTIEQYLTPFLKKFGANIAWELCGEAIIRTTDDDSFRDLDLLTMEELAEGLAKAELKSPAKK